jgi:Fur family ferric uptake transcriptional regulator
MKEEVILPSKKTLTPLGRLAPHEPVVLQKSEDTSDLAKKVIRDMNLKVTDQRLLILEVIHKGRSHVTAQEVFESVHQVDPSVGFATVYRFLRNLTEFGHLTEIRVGGLPARYELAQQTHHDHLTCTACGKICEFENQIIEELQIQTAHQFGFRLTHHVLELYGVCSDCDQLAKYAANENSQKSSNNSQRT